jgi:2-amino-4-hydroxy-6-hydroxymethyldihydropteridine diphosphokinase
MKTPQSEKLYAAVGNSAWTSARAIWISLGANVGGTWGNPKATILTAIREIEKLQLCVVASSPLYSTIPLGNVRQPRYLNMVICVIGSFGPVKLLHAIKRLEVAAGRRKRGRWGPRPLDLDILDYGGRIIGRFSRRRIEGRLVLPHPEMHKRGFVLVPLAAACRAWHHPRLHMSARQLLARHPSLSRGIRRLPHADPHDQSMGRQA